MALGCLALAARFLLAALSVGSNDVGIWEEHARAVAEHGVRWAYENRPLYNHPPLMGYWSAFAFNRAHGDAHVFSLWLKLPGLLVELLSAFLVYRAHAGRGALAAARTVAVYGLSLPLLLVAGYHGNSDCAYAGLTLLAVFLLERERPFWAGLALALALNVKLMPIFLVPPLLLSTRSWRAAGGFVSGLALAAIPYMPFVLTTRGALLRNVLSYNSLQDEWGIVAFLHAGSNSGSFASPAAIVAEKFVPNGRYLIVAAVLLVAVAARWRPRWNRYELGALAWALFLVLAPGFGVQYAVCVLPLLFAAAPRRAVTYSMLAGGFAFVVYFSKMSTVSIPLGAEVQGLPFPPLAVLFGVLAWATLVRFVGETFVLRLWRGRPRARGIFGAWEVSPEPGSTP